MFPLSIQTYIKLGAVTTVLLFVMYLGYSFEHSRFVAFKATIVAETATAERKQQAAADKIEKEKNAQIASINNQLVDAISELRKRPSRAQQTCDGQGRTGATLSAEDAEFLTREAARADIIRSGLSACYQQYDSISK
jgi:hypothetical protein